jgi:hypothetical protein
VSTVLGDGAGLYDRARPPYSPLVAEVTPAFAGRELRRVIDARDGAVALTTVVPARRG